MNQLYIADHFDALLDQLVKASAITPQQASAHEVRDELGSLQGRPAIIRQTSDELRLVLYREQARDYINGHEVAIYGVTMHGFVQLSPQQVRGYTADLPSAVIIEEVGLNVFTLKDDSRSALVTVTDDAEAELLRTPFSFRHPAPSHQAQSFARRLLYPLKATHTA